MNETTNEATVDLTAELTKCDLIQSWHAINRELADAPAWRIDTKWFMDRERELRHLEARLAMLGVTTW